MSTSGDPSGTDWTQSEIDLVVSDYFDMRAKFLRAEPFVKARHYESIVNATGRSKGSVEAKYMNISATLERLSLPWIKGYAPLRNFQGALLKSVEGFIAKEWNEEPVQALELHSVLGVRQLFIEKAPDLTADVTSNNPELERLAKKFDPALRDYRNRKTGLAGERRAYESEKRRLTTEGRPDLARKVNWVSQELGDGAGFDILSFDNSGKELFLEVKTTVGHKRTPFFLSRNEKAFSEESGDRYRIFRIYEWGKEPKAFLIEPPLVNSLILEPSTYRASFG
jgi:hypothetical protein